MGEESKEKKENKGNIVYFWLKKGLGEIILKRVVSVSLGSSNRDHKVRVKLLGEDIEISRVGVDGDFERALELLTTLDGEVDAIGLGGIDVYVYVAKKRYAFEDGLKLLKAVKKTPVVDGSGLKNTLERKTVKNLVRETDLIKPGSKVMMVSAADRFGMAEALAEAGCEMTFGDLIFAAGIPYPINTLEELEQIAKKILPELVKMPFEMLYPVGDKQDKIDRKKAEKFEPYYKNADILAGDFHLIKRFLPPRLDGQIILTNTTTSNDVSMLKECGAGYLITSTPELEGRSFGTNVIEAALVALIGKHAEEITADDYNNILDELDFKPRILKFVGK